MITLGLTGGIASGKSTVLSMFARLGAVTYDADKAVHELLARDLQTAQSLAATFGLPPTPPVDRKALGKLVFADPQKLAQLEAILHPQVRMMEQRVRRRAFKEGRRLVVCDIPLLFETDANSRYDTVITTACPASLQEARALSRPGMTPERLQHVRARQLPQHEKMRRADFVVHTGLGRAYSMRQVMETMKALGL